MLFSSACAEPAAVSTPTPTLTPRTIAPEVLFLKLGCPTCHADGAPNHAEIVAARTKDEAEIARWIRNARAIKPDTTMPVFEERLSEGEALSLARWIKSSRGSESTDR